MKSFTFLANALSLAWLVDITTAQANQNALLRGPVFPAPSHPDTSKAVQAARKAFPKVLDEALSTGLLDNSTTSFSINVFSTSDNKTLLSHHFEAPGLNGSLPSGSLDDDTIYRIGSLSKLFTVYTLLAKNGFADFHQPITKYIPELAAADTNSSLNDVQWSDITVEALASQMAGITRDYGIEDLANLQTLNATATGLPTESNAPVCGFGPGFLKPCDRKEYIAGLLSQTPLTSTYNTPIYSNAGFVLLSLVIESITNQSFSAAFHTAILQPLNMSRTSVIAPNDTNIIIPGGLEQSDFLPDLGVEDPAGSFFSTPSDLITLGRSILQSAILPSALTRRWIQPHATTSHALHLVGAPWEIFRQSIPISSTTNTTRLVDLYTKSGDIPNYASALALDTDHNIGFSILAAGSQTTNNRGVLASLIANTWVPALEAAAREEANATYIGTYTDTKTNTTLEITTDADRPGLNVATFIANGVNFKDSILAFNDVTPEQAAAAGVEVSIRLYPSGLSEGELVGFRAVVEILPYSPASLLAPFDTWGDAWLTVDGTTYGAVGIDDFVFKLGGAGKTGTREAVEVLPRVLREGAGRVVKGA
ncbi:beta-lactamase/transpeptidase-like protein [Mytilinidion resinicola]|uniref:Beta-lactamase/transpeptidase-like protein n=1 Tax=Mytilinidion resinicola TaxID=574789 RepID=A0A6A6YF03_9PEZI|nr:beta-lactamase/transpeptidase-like protein [Mytilinidion resinicola]KAF2807189.1 beta-lactamase/transpeptidase-like protein [Mytilinidion resinicola]